MAIGEDAQFFVKTIDMVNRRVGWAITALPVSNQKWTYFFFYGSRSDDSFFFSLCTATQFLSA